MANKNTIFPNTLYVHLRGIIKFSSFSSSKRAGRYLPQPVPKQANHSQYPPQVRSRKSSLESSVKIDCDR